MGKVEIGIYFCVTADILKKVLQKCFWGSPLPTIWILSKSQILIGCYGNRKAKFWKKYSKIFFSEALRGMELKFCINVHDISFYINNIFLLSLPMCFRCYGNLKFPHTYKGKSGNWHPTSSVNIFKRYLLWSHKADYYRISPHIAFIDRGDE